MNDIALLIQLFGRLHIVVLHAPLGLIPGLAFIELVALIRCKPAARDMVSPLVLLMAVSVVLAAGTGYVLNFEGSNQGPTLERHQQLGIVLAIVGVLLALSYVTIRKPIVYRLLLLVAVGLIVPVGHLGGSMTHGAKFLTEPFAYREPVAPATQPEETTNVFSATVAPVLAQRCVSCHGESRRKGGLALHTAGGVAEGGQSGPVVVAGKPEASEIMRRLRLPLDDDDHMPPAGKPQPTEDQIQVIEAWIIAGAPLDSAPAAGSEMPSDLNASETDVAEDVPLPDSEALVALRDRLVHFEVVSEGSNLLAVSFRATARQTNDTVARKLLEPLLPVLAEVALGRSGVGDQTVSLLAGAANLRRLDLAGTKITDAGLAPLTRLEKLEELVLVRTNLTDGAVEHLAAMPTLQRVYLWEAGLSDEGVARLRESRPELRVDVGDSPQAAELEVEPDLVFSSDRPLPGESPTSAALRPVNATCPVTGKPICADFAIVHKKRVIGFCCAECVARFWADPEKFESKLPPIESGSPATGRQTGAPAESD